MFDKEFLAFERIGVQPPRAYYIPFSDGRDIPLREGIIDREASDRFYSLNGIWQIKEHHRLNDVFIEERLNERIEVPSCVQMKGYDGIQYLNTRYPFPFDPPYVPEENPVYHYRRAFLADIGTEERLYLNFEGVDSAFYVYVNGCYVGYGQISHATNEFDVTPFVRSGENTLDVVVLKWCASSYLECQDKFRFTGIFRSVYLLRRPKAYITDFKITTDLVDGHGVIRIENLSEIAFRYETAGKSGEIAPAECAEVMLSQPRVWTAEDPALYDVHLFAGGEKILQRVGIRTVSIENGVFKINGKHVKLKGVNRHEFDCKNGATVTLAGTIEDLKLMKWANVNAIRTSHYPDCPEFYDLCDVMGFYLIDEADLETHGIACAQSGYDRTIWQKYADCGLFNAGVRDRHINLYERDKNRTCVLIWSLGNESSYGSMFYAGADYIHAHDKRPIHYEGNWESDHSDYYTSRIDIASRMYPPLEFFEEFLADEKETRPLVLCEYSHAMGNSNGDLNDYWKIIDSNDRFMGAFVWEWCDHAVKTEKGFLYGGDFGEKEHDGNFCVDGLVMPDRKIKSNLLELRAVYGGKRIKPDTPACAPLTGVFRRASISFEVDERGRLESVGGVAFTKPVTINILRAFLDNDKPECWKWQRFQGFRQEITKREERDGSIILTGRVVVNCLQPMLLFTLTYTPFDEGIDICFRYEVADYIDYLPRIGLEFGLDSSFNAFSYTAYGPVESYIDKHLASEYGEYGGLIAEDYSGYIRPQECGSHYGATRLEICGSFTVTAEKPFSFSALPWSTVELDGAEHAFELPPRSGSYVNLDVAMSGVGTHSCGPELRACYRAPKKGENTFRITLAAKK